MWLQDAGLQGAPDDRGVRRQAATGAQRSPLVRGVREALQGAEGQRTRLHVQASRLEEGEPRDPGRDLRGVQRRHHTFRQTRGTIGVQRLDQH